MNELSSLALAATDQSVRAIEITVFTKDNGPLTKRISLNPEGRLKSDGSACSMQAGNARRERFAGARDLARFIHVLPSDQAIALGALKLTLPDKVRVTTAHKLQRVNVPNLIARTEDFIQYRPGHLALILLDFDTKGMPEPVRAKIEQAGGFWGALTSVLPGLASAERIERLSTSSGISRTDTGVAVPGSDGRHVYLFGKDGTDIRRFLYALHDRCWLAGFGWLTVGKAGQFLERSIIDRAVFSAERLVFEGQPELAVPLRQERPFPRAIDGEIVDTFAVCPDLTEAEKARLAALIHQAKDRLAPEATNVRGKYVKQRAEEITKHAGVTPEAARRIVERQCAGVLLPHVMLPFDDDDLEGCTLRDVLADPDRFVGATLADPVEGIGYGRCKAKILRGHEGSLFINSFAHGGAQYKLRHDATTIEPEMRAKEAEAHHVLARMLPEADLEEDAAQQLRELACKLANVKISTLNQMIKTKRLEQHQKHASERNAREAAELAAGRVTLPAPPVDAERLPVLRKLDEVLRAVDDLLPPVRDIECHPVAIRIRRPSKLSALTSASANNEEDENSRLPAPEMPLICRHDEQTLEHMLEQHVMFYTGNKNGERRAVALDKAFVRSYMAYRDSRLPILEAIVTLPLVLPNGQLLMKDGYDPEYQTAFMISPELQACIPTHTPTERDVADALDFLANRWLCDVSTDFLGKCTLIAFALTIIERVLLPQRPAFFVTAGKRGGGKTTALLMTVVAATGKGAPAQPWSWKAEERRKALLSSLLQAPPVLVWDNIPVGTEISCPFLEAALTNESFADRILGKSELGDAKTHTVMAMTGNNISGVRDMASRHLKVNIGVDRPDPENREFTHVDPIGWTHQNRGCILKALYTILLGNPRLTQQPAEREQPKTRYKPWWELVGSAVEYGSAALVKAETYKCSEQKTATVIDFGAAIAAVEAADAESNLDAEVLNILYRKWRDNGFKASDVVPLFASGDESAPLTNEDKATLRARFDPSGQRGANISSKAVGKVLTAMLNAPFYVGGCVMELKDVTTNREREARRPATYRVEIKRRG